MSSAGETRSRRLGLHAASELRASALFHVADACRHLVEAVGRNRLCREVWAATVWPNYAGPPGKGCAEWWRHQWAVAVPFSSFEKHRTFGAAPKRLAGSRQEPSITPPGASRTAL